MRKLTGAFVAQIAMVWHRFILEQDDGEDLAAMLAPMDEAGEVIASGMLFDMEPSDFELGLNNLAPGINIDEK